MKAILSPVLAFLLCLPAVRGNDSIPVTPETRLKALESEVVQLRSQIKQLEATLRAKGVLPPSKSEHPEAWTLLEVRLDAAGELQMDGKPATTDAIKTRVAAVFQSGKFPSVRLVAPQLMPFARVKTILDLLGTLGVPDVSMLPSAAPQ